MGNLTTITIYNDGIQEIEENKEEFMTSLLETIRGGGGDIVGTKKFANLAKVQKTRHSDNWTVYVHAGNTLVELNPFRDDILLTIKKNKEFCTGMIEYLSDCTKALKIHLKSLSLKTKYNKKS